MTPKERRSRTYEQVWLSPRKALPDAHSYLPCGTLLAAYDQAGQILVRYIISHGNFAYLLGRCSGDATTQDLVISRRSLRSQGQDTAGVICFHKFEAFLIMHQTKLLRDALWKAQGCELIYDARLSQATLSAIARDMSVAVPPVDPELAKFVAERDE